MQNNWNQLLHWTSQIIPPLSLMVLFSRHGPGFWFLIGIPILCLLISSITLAIKLCNFKKNKRFLIRPILTISISSVLFIIASYSYNVATAEADEIFKIIDAQCKLNNACPLQIKGWKELEAGKRYRTKVGGYITYPLTYYNSENKFSLYLYQSLDLGKYYEGGINL